MALPAFPTSETPGLLRGKTALVTGGVSGIGRAIAALFKASGATVIVADIGAKDSDQAAVGEFGPLWHADVASEESVARLAARIAAGQGALDILVNCAGVPQSYTPIETMTVEAWDRIMNVNTRSLFLMAKHFLPLLRGSGNAAVVNICSVIAVRPKPGLAAYGASKAAAVATTLSLALELAKDGIRVNGINPGATETPMLSGFTGGKQVQDVVGAFASQIPMGEIIRPDDIAGAALYLASDLARLVTGSILNVDGGRSV
ncbi:MULTISPECIES: glucose 1-dehydrogenase [unclassified Beijerinckia]|uniref:SDR family NAD(P)-dependent oxidoreductase n=1 Tax=unclassified Beijerinckia TaxID=2638183 RepID=UPI0008975F8B|nr:MULTISPECIES: glucose 1-dehydrogenase [unclassified Beijerinckia]MDH7796960.1 3-oxoacyl-[acyl-carrier protein] reductase [Beijerinckia sp. GAS462]SEC66694.1 3-oxoacyl-[acyl-carrier protein] reductase [Beijerinckia sp. 28-YEA-48]